MPNNLFLFAFFFAALSDKKYRKIYADFTEWSSPDQFEKSLSNPFIYIEFIAPLRFEMEKIDWYEKIRK